MAKHCETLRFNTAKHCVNFSLRKSYLEIITKIAQKGKHTFLVGEFPQLPK